MCGIVGAVVRRGRLSEADVRRAVGALSHRGPDAAKVQLVGSTAEWDIWFGHARLSIVDLSEGGSQPMTVRTVSGAGVVGTFNGELYNHQALRKTLADGYAFRSTSDTEVLLAGLALEGPEFLKRCNAMLALGLWNERDGTLMLARDRLGKKPLYVYQDEDRLLFASETKALASLGAPLVLDERSLALFRWLGYVPSGRSIWRGIRQVPAATFATFDLRGASLPALAPKPYWDPLAACATTFAGTFDDAVDETLRILDDATKLRLEADVPVGVFLSGGIDSSLVAASVARSSAHETTAFVIRADAAEFDESPVARRTAERLGLKLEVLHLKREDYARQLDKVPWHFDEPLADLSQIATMANAEAARQHVTVVLTGDGGDEVFLGYPWVAYPERLLRWRKPLEAIPGGRLAVRAMLATPLGKLGLRLGVRALGLNEGTLDAKRQIARDVLVTRDPAEIYDRFQCARQRDQLSEVDLDRIRVPTLLALARETYPDYSWDAAQSRSLPELFGALDLVTYLRGDILAKVDRATMAYSLEARCPLLDYRMVELGLSLPVEYKIRGGSFKRVLREACARRVGDEVAGLPKRGFGIPEPVGMPAGQTTGERWTLFTERRFFATWGAGAAPERLDAARSLAYPAAPREAGPVNPGTVSRDQRSGNGSAVSEG